MELEARGPRGWVERGSEARSPVWIGGRGSGTGGLLNDAERVWLGFHHVRIASRTDNAIS